MERLIVEETYNQLGELKTDANFDIIFSGPDPNTCNTISEYIKSKADPEAGHAGVVNVYQGKYRHVILPRLALTAAGAADSTKRRYWGIVSSELSSFYLGMWEAPHIIPPQEPDSKTDDLEFGNRAGIGICIVGANWAKFSSGDGTA